MFVVRRPRDRGFVTEVADSFSGQSGLVGIITVTMTGRRPVAGPPGFLAVASVTPPGSSSLSVTDVCESRWGQLELTPPFWMGWYVTLVYRGHRGGS
jgi:hypothetical protein